MAADNAEFNAAAQQFLDYGQSVRGYVRYKVTQHNIQKYLGDEPLDIIDIGGGSGVDSLWLAELGHNVILAEPAEEQRKLADTRFKAAPADVQDRLAIMPGRTTELLAAGHEGLYDLVLAHGVVMYMDDPEAFVAELVRLAKPEGFISLLDKGYYGKQAHLILKEEWPQLEKLQETSMMFNDLGHAAWCFKPEKIENMLTKAGAKVTEWSGVRLVSDWMEMPITDLEPANLDRLIEIELEQGHDKHSRGQGQMLHFIAQKSS